MPSWGSDYIYRAGLITGPFLPWDVTGIDETMKVIGISSSAREQFGIGFEASAFHSAESGAVINYATFGLVKSFQFPDLEFMEVLISAGVQLSYNRMAGVAGPDTPYTSGGGIYGSGGFALQMSRRLEIQPRMTLLNGSGRALLMEIGLQYRFGEISQEAR